MEHKVKEAIVTYRNLEPGVKKILIKTDYDAVPFFRRILLEGEPREQFMSLSMDGAGQFVSVRQVSIGSALNCHANPRDVFQAANIEGAVSVILAHNHPDGGTNPSKTDKALTKVLINAGLILGITVIDHLIITDDRWLSLRGKWPSMFPSRPNVKA